MVRRHSNIAIGVSVANCVLPKENHLYLAIGPGAYVIHHSHMECFRNSLAGIDTLKHRAIASLSLAIGGASAIILLRQAIQSARY